MPEWLIEEGIGEDRALRLSGATITDAILEWHDDLRPGEITDARLISRNAGARRGVVGFANGQKALIDNLPAQASEGAPIRVEVVRSALFEDRRSKLAVVRPTTLGPNPAPSLAQRLRSEGCDVRVVNRFPECDWYDLIAEAEEQTIAFAGGTLHFSPTPAMTLIDIDAQGGARHAARAAIPAIASALRRFGIGGSIGIDFPTLSTKSERRAIDEALDEALTDWPHERTAINGFGFVQIVARLRRPSLLHILAYRRERASVHTVLRRAEHLDGPGAVVIGMPQSLIDRHLDPALLAELRRRTGREVRLEPAIDGSGTHAQLVPR